MDMTIIRLFKKNDLYTAVINERVYELGLNADKPRGWCEYLGLAVEFKEVLKVIQGRKSSKLGTQVELWDAPMCIRRGIAKAIKEGRVK